MSKKNTRIVMLPVEISNEITDEMVQNIKDSGKPLSVNQGNVSEQGCLKIIENHLGIKGWNANESSTNSAGFDYEFENGYRIEHKKMVVGKTQCRAKSLGKNKKGRCTHFSFHHPAQNAIYIISAYDFYRSIDLNYDGSCNTYDVGFYSDMKLEGLWKHTKSLVHKNTKALIEFGTKIELKKSNFSEKKLQKD